MNNSTPLTVGSWLSDGWDIYVKNFRKIIEGAILLIGLPSLLLLIGMLLPTNPFIITHNHNNIHQMIIRFYSPGIHFYYFITYLCFFLFFSLSLAIGWLYLCLKLARGENAELSDMFIGFKFLKRLLFANVEVVFITLLGFLLLIIPGIIWFVKYSLSFLVIIDKKTSPVATMDLCEDITKGNIFNIFILYFLGFILMAILQFPFAYVFLRTSYESGILDTLFCAICYIGTIFFISPWISASIAVAYDRLSKLENTGENTEISNNAMLGSMA